MMKQNGFSLDEIKNMTEPQLDLYLKEIQRSNSTRFVDMANAARLAQAPQNDYQRIIDNALYEVEE